MKFKPFVVIMWGMYLLNAQKTREKFKKTQFSFKKLTIWTRIWTNM